jgi:hypothetical protein
MPVNAEILTEIAKEVKATERHQYERTFIFYFIPEEVSGVKASPWATTDFNPSLEVNIMGLTPDQVAELQHIKIEHPGKRLGAWLINSAYVSRVTAMYEDGGEIKKADYHGHGKPHVTNMVELPSERGRRFHTERGTDLYEIGEDGILRIYADDGDLLIGAKPLKPMEE